VYYLCVTKMKVSNSKVILKLVLSYLSEIDCEIRQLQSERRNETMRLEFARAEHDASESSCTCSH
jgi:hypothetical protein